MARYIVRRLLLLIPVILGVTFLTFILIRIIPGDIVTKMMGVTAANNPEVRFKILHELGLDRPLLEQYVWWLGRIFQGDFGYSFIHGKPVMEQILRRLPITLQLGVMSMLIAILMGPRCGPTRARWRTSAHGSPRARGSLRPRPSPTRRGSYSRRGPAWRTWRCSTTGRNSWHATSRRPR